MSSLEPRCQTPRWRPAASRSAASATSATMTGDSAMLVAACTGWPLANASNQPLKTPTGRSARTLVTRRTAAGSVSRSIACSTASFWAPYSFFGGVAEIEEDGAGRLPGLGAARRGVDRQSELAAMHLQRGADETVASDDKCA